MSSFNLSIRVLLFCTWALLFSCKAKKAVLKPEAAKANAANTKIALSAEEEFYQRILTQKTFSSELSFNAEADYKDGSQNVTLNLDVSARRDQYIFMGAKALGFVNVARVLIQPDSIRILDLINRKYISASYKYMQSFSSAPIGFEQLQNIVWGNAPFDPKYGQTKIDSLKRIFTLVLNLGNTLQSATYSPELKTESVVLSEQARPREMQVQYRNRKVLDGINYPHEILIHIQGEKKVDCKFSISNFAGTIKKEPQFVVPRSYKVQVY